MAKRKRNRKRLLTQIRTVDSATGKVLFKHHGLMAASDKARKIAMKTGRDTEVRDEFGLYLKYPGSMKKNPNPSIPRGKWVKGHIKVTKSGKIQFKRGSTKHNPSSDRSWYQVWSVRVPPTMEQGSYTTNVSGSTQAEARANALWDYNSARAHDGLPPVKRLPAGTKVVRGRGGSS